jgi:putative tricarboxylic transport membrane protein
MPALARVAAPLAGAIAAAALFIGTRGLDDVARGEQLGPGFWPRLVLAGLIVACVAKLIENRRRIAPADPARPAAGLVEVRRTTLAVAVALIVLYVVLTPWLGFPLVTAGFIAAFMVLAGARSPLGIGLTAVVGTVGLLYLFVKLVYLPLPKGDGVFEALTLALYRALGIF